MAYKLNRRRFLVNASGHALTLPFLPSLFSDTELNAQAATPRKNLIVVFSSNGAEDSITWNNQALSYTNRGTNLKELALSQIAGPMTPILGAGFDSLRQKMLMLRGLDGINTKFFGHYGAKLLNGYGAVDADHPTSAEINYPTIDQIIAYSPSFYPSEPVGGRSLHLLTKGWQNSGHPMSVRKNTNGSFTINNAESSAQSVFDRLFRGAGQSDSERQKKLLQREKTTEALLSDFNAFRAGPNLSTSDRNILDEHLAYLNALELRTAAEKTSQGCTTPQRPAVIDQGTEASDNEVPFEMKNQIDVMVAALQCDLTRIVVLQMSATTDVRPYSFLSGGTNHHSASHVGDKNALRTINTWLMDQYAYLLRQLDSAKDPLSGRSILDDSLVIYVNEMGTYIDNHWHETYSIPVFMAGSLGGWFRTGYLLDYRHPTKRAFFLYNGTPVELPGDRPLRGVAYNQLLVTILQAFGVDPLEYQNGFGDYSGNISNQYDLTTKGQPLPLVKI